MDATEKVLEIEADPEDLQFNDPPRIVWVLVRDAVGLIWDRNPKEHDLGALINSIQKYGFQEVPKYDVVLGGIKSGNGRTEAAYKMEQAGMVLPRGLAITKDGAWAMPIMVGTDAASEALAAAYAIDANNLTLMGGAYDAVEISRIWDQEDYVSLLSDLAEIDELPVSVDGDDLDALLRVMDGAGDGVSDPGAEVDKAEALREKWGG